MSSAVTSSAIASERRQHAEVIIDRLKAGLAPALTRFPVEMVYLHGSMARGHPLPDSDVDLAIVLQEPLPPPYEQLKLELDVQAAIEDACGLTNVDVRAINTAPITVQGNVLQEGLRLYARDLTQCATFESLVRRMYFDYRPRAEAMQAAMLRHMREKGLRYG
jgi:predicted nucleotidyltransferase